MQIPHPEDEFDWRGCSAVQWEDGKLSGRANVNGCRMFADHVLRYYDDGMSIDDIIESYEQDSEPVRQIIAFAVAKRLEAAA